MFVEGEEVFYSVAVGVEGFVAVGAVNGSVELGVRFQQVGRHGKRVIEVGKRRGWVGFAGVEDGLGGGLDGGAVLGGWVLRPRIVVIDDII